MCFIDRVGCATSRLNHAARRRNRCFVMLLHQSTLIDISVYTSFLAVVWPFYPWKAKTLPYAFNEARNIRFSMYILLLSSVAYYPLYLGLKGSYATRS